MMRRARRSRLAFVPPSIDPHRCVLVAVDSGERSGWSIWAVGKLVQFGECNGYMLPEVQAVIAAALQLAEIAALPTVLVYERPTTYRAKGTKGGRSMHTVLGMGATRGVWRAAWVSAGCAERKIADAPIPTWRSRVLGKGWGGGVAREVVKPHELATARAIVTQHLGAAQASEVGEESAPAICIGKWGSHAPQIARKLPKHARAAA